MDRGSVGICWDFGYANLMDLDQPGALRYIGKRPKTTHVADNSGYYDDHIMPVLRKIRYEGDFAYEIHNATSRLPGTLPDKIGRYCLLVGRYLLDL